MKCFRCNKDMSDIEPDYSRVCNGGVANRSDKDWFCAEEPETVFDVYWWIRNSAPRADHAMNAIATTRAALEERDTLDLLTYLREKAFAVFLDDKKTHHPNVISVGGQGAVITGLNIHLADPVVGQHGKIEIEYVVLEST